MSLEFESGTGGGFSDFDYAAFTQRVQKMLGIRLSDYKEEQMRRRVGTMAKQAKCDSFVTYFSAMQQNNELLKNFLDQMTINVTELMRNPELFEDLGKHILPELVRMRSGMTLSIWSAGCSYGAEAYTLAMLLNEMTPTPQYRIKGTDLDLAVLAKANAATFSKLDMTHVSKERRERHFMEIDENTFMPKPELRRNIQFGQHDLLADSYPVDMYDLILCRNVVIYFTDEAKERIYQGFSQALRPGGVLFVGGTERLGDSSPLDLELIRPFFYRSKKGGFKAKAA